MEQRPATAASARYSTASRKSLNATPKSELQNTTKQDLRTLTYSGDYLDRHKDRFVNESQMPFMPRTKKRKGKSFLSQSRHYAPPVTVDRSSTKDDKSPSTGSGGSKKGAAAKDGGDDLKIIIKKDEKDHTGVVDGEADMTADNLKKLEVPELEIER